MATEVDLEGQSGDDKPSVNHKSTLQTRSQVRKLNKKKAVGFPLLVVGGLTVAIALIALWRRPTPSSISNNGVNTPDNNATANTIPPLTGPADIGVLGDTFLGYSTLWAEPFKQKLAASKITIGYADEFDQKIRAEKLSSGEVDFMVTSINQLFETPSTGKIVAMWDWTHGADRLVLNNKQLPEVTSVQDLNRAATRAAEQGELLSIIFAGATPSEYLSLLLADKSPDFALEKFNIVRVDDSSTAWQRFQNPLPGEKFAAGIFWEPYVTQATRQGYVASLSSADVQRSIVDVVVASPQVLKESPGKVQAFVKAYYEHMDRSAVDKTGLREQFETLGELTPSEALNFLQGVYFFDANCANHWMSGSNKLLEQRLDYTARLLYGSNRIADVPNNLGQLYDGRFVAQVASSNAAESCPEVRVAAAQSDPSVRSQVDNADGASAIIAVNVTEEAAQLDAEAIYALEQVLNSVNQGDAVTIDATFTNDRTFSFVKARLDTVEQYVVKKFPTANIRTTLSPEKSQHPSVQVSIGDG